jgi:hypothetical protein
MTVKTPTPPPLPAEVVRLLRRLRMRYVRHAAPEVVATAKSQRWDPAVVLRVRLAEEAAGRDRARRSGCVGAQAGCRPARPSTHGNETATPIPAEAPERVEDCGCCAGCVEARLAAMTP